jgi:hypothetical protein
MAVGATAIIGLAATAATTAISYNQSQKQKKLQLEAESEATKAINEAKEIGRKFLRPA